MWDIQLDNSGKLEAKPKVVVAAVVAMEPVKDQKRRAYESPRKTVAACH